MESFIRVTQANILRDRAVPSKSQAQAGTFPSKSFVDDMKDATMDLLLKVNGEKRFIGDISKAKQPEDSDRSFKFKLET